VKAIKQIGIVAGEASGDLHGASLVRALKESGKPLAFFGLGGPRLREAGVEMVYPPPLNVVGFTEVVAKIAQIFRAFQKVKQTLVDRSADLLVLIDYPELNLRLARFAHRRNIPVLFYISPQVWAWRAGRVKTIARVVDRMAVILPFEEAFYRDRGMAVEFVGHPLVDILEETHSLKEDPELDDAGPESTVIGLLPGSRPTEVNQILPVLLDTAWSLKQRFSGPLVFWLPIAPSLDPLVIREKAAPYQARGLSLRLISGISPTALKRCDLALVASGTATLEAAILGVPMIIVYKVSAINYWIAKRLIQVPYIGLVNWIAGEKIISEYVQEQAHPEALTEEAWRLLNDPVRREELRAKMALVRQKLGGPGASSRVARMALEMLSG
jgi:lipid-A-disaccharide synthase